MWPTYIIFKKPTNLIFIIHQAILCKADPRLGSLIALMHFRSILRQPKLTYTTRAISKQLHLDLSKPCLTYLHANPQQESAINLITHRSLFTICNQLFSHPDLLSRFAIDLVTYRSFIKIRVYLILHTDLQQKPAIDLVTHESFIKICG